MKEFVFKLQTALDVKLKEEDLQKEKLFRARQVFEHNLQVLNQMRDQLAEVMDRIRVQQANRVGVAEVTWCQEFIPVINNRIRSQEVVLEESRQVVEAINGQIIEIMKGRKTLERIKTRHYQAYMLEFRREEQKAIDEMAAAAYRQKESVIKQGGQ